MMSKWKPIILATLFYCIVFAIYTYPFIPQIDKLLLGEGDAFQFIWNSYYFKHKLSQGDFFTSDLMFFPWGENSLLHAGTISCSIFSLLGDNLLITNLYLSFHSILAAIGGFLFAKHFKLSFLGALVTGFIFAYSPFKMARLEEHYNIAMTGFVPFFTLFFFKAFDFHTHKVIPQIRTIKFLALAILMGFLQALTDFVIMFHMIYFAGIVFLYFYVKQLRNKMGSLKATALIIIVFLVFHGLTDYLSHHDFHDKGALWWRGYWRDFFRPDRGFFYDNTTGDFLRNLFSRKNAGLESIAFMGYSLLFFFLMSVFWFFSSNRNSGGKLLFIIVCIILIALPKALVIYSPFSFLHFIPGLNQLRCPERIVNYLYLLIPVFTFIQLKDFLNYIHRKNFQTIISALLLSVLFIEYYPSKYTFTDFYDVPQAVRALESKDGEGVLVYPFGIRDGYTSTGRFELEQFQFQMAHHKKQLGGYFSRVSDGLRAKYLANRFINDLIGAQEGTINNISSYNYKDEIEELAFTNALILNKYKSEAGAAFLSNALLNAGFQEIEYEDGSIFTLNVPQ